MTEILKPQETKSTPTTSPDSQKESGENKYGKDSPERIEDKEKHTQYHEEKEEPVVKKILASVNDAFDSGIENLTQPSPSQGFSGFWGEAVAAILKILQDLGIKINAYVTDLDDDDDDKIQDNKPTSSSSRPKKTMSQAELSQFLQQLRKEKIDGKTAGDTVIRAIRDNIQNLHGNHCWDWVDKIYKKANVTRKDIYPFRKYSGKDCGNLNYNDKLDILEPGDWIYINNRNNSDTWGCHSLIFLGWVDQNKKIAYTASCPRPGLGRAPETRDLAKNPVTYIAKPSFS